METKRIERLWQEAAPPAENPQPLIAEARARQPSVNARIAPEELPRRVRLEPAAERLLADAAARWSLSARAVHRTIRVARTVADLSAASLVGTEAVLEALSFRNEIAKGEPTGTAP